MEKICTHCGKELDAEQDFNWKYKDRGIRHSRCKFCQSQVSKQHYENNKQDYMTRIHARDSIVLQDHRLRLAAYLESHHCVDCRQTDMRVLDFDHVRGDKLGHISRMLLIGCSWSTITVEIEKCEVRCANCHRIKTGQTGNSWRNFFVSLNERLSPNPLRSSDAARNAQVRVENQQRLHAYLSTHPCVDCNCLDIRVLEFDHVHGKKAKSISELLKNSASWPRIQSEIAKCEVRCANCHRIQTMERGGWWRIKLSEQE